ncbi:hypothetical protein F2P81_020371 [Scophthalmus maximus]|uniref:Uncharacterized protein n=1 Tax=Scophthalmus maximus TaxID=52904 RepID=A0A6A4S7U3_SCOMX|nr:hypothetical protein F2P81_020371 [Scophthalmus maximus]
MAVLFSIEKMSKWPRQFFLTSNRGYENVKRRVFVSTVSTVLIAIVTRSLSMPETAAHFRKTWMLQLGRDVSENLDLRVKLLENATRWRAISATVEITELECGTRTERT